MANLGLCWGPKEAQLCKKVDFVRFHSYIKDLFLFERRIGESELVLSYHREYNSPNTPASKHLPSQIQVLP